MRRLRDVGEHGWLERLVRRLGGRGADGVLVGIGDDAAVVRVGRRRLILTTDALVEGVHFRRGWLSAAALGRRAYGAAASDVAAMGGRPRFVLLGVEAPADCGVAQLDALVAGAAAAARRQGARLVGGNLTRAPRLAITLAVVGEARGPVVTRAGARPGDLLYVTGRLGECGLAVRRLRAGRRARLPAPPSRARAGALLAPLAHAMIDVSDGLVHDVGHVCRASGVRAEIDLTCVPVAPVCRRALGGRAAAFAATAGEDYELVVAIPPRRERALASLRARLGCPIRRVGRITRGRGVRVLEGGRTVRLSRGGFDHFR